MGVIPQAAGDIPLAHELRADKTRACRQAGLTALQIVRNGYPDLARQQQRLVSAVLRW
ncbi:MAG: hypothetical protein AB1815_04710 [Bacillota bacterium]